MSTVEYGSRPSQPVPTLLPPGPVLTRAQREALQLAVGALTTLSADPGLPDPAAATFVAAAVELNGLLTQDRART